MTLKSLLLGAVTAIAIPVVAHASSLVANGSFENGTFGCCGYYSLANGSTDITGWTVGSTGGPIAWGIGTNDVVAAADGIAYVDLTGLSNDSLDGSLSQSVATVASHQYLFSMASFGDLAAVSVGAQTLILSPNGNIGSWTLETATFVGVGGPQLLTISNVTPGSQIVFVDDVSLLDVGATPLPSAWLMMAGGLVGGRYLLRRRRRKAD